jgi:hypothetical protein
MATGWMTYRFEHAAIAGDIWFSWQTGDVVRNLKRQIGDAQVSGGLAAIDCQAIKGGTESN